MILEPGTQIGDYRIRSRIGKGAYGIVFEAEHIITQRIDALKVMLDAGCSAEDEQRFLREIQVQASLQHPNIAAVYHAFRTSSGLVLIMERVPGESLRAILDRGRLPLAEGLRYISDTLAGLDYAERAGVIHRDIKPENILITPDGAAKLTDFGLAHVMNQARLTGSGESLGTPTYISPEQIDGLGEVDARTDVYSVGVVLYEVLTGQAPFWAENGFAVMRAHRDVQPTPPVKFAPEIGERLNGVILKAMEKEPSKRFQSSAEFRAALQEAIAPPRAAARPVGFKARSAGAAVLAGFAICSAMLAGGVWGFRHRPAPPVQAKKNVEPAQPVLPAPVAAPVPETAPPIVVEEPVAVRVEPVRVKRAVSAPVAAKAPAPRPSSPLLIRMEDGAVAVPASAPAKEIPSEPAPAAAIPAATEAPPPATISPVAPSAPQPAEAPGAETKKRNVVVRTLNRLFHKKTPPPAVKPSADLPARIH